MDRECESFFHLSPYSYCGGDPINFIDPTGNRIVAYDGDMEWEFRQVDGEYGFFNADNERYAGDNNFMYSLENSLNKINSCAIGNAVIDKLIGTADTLTLEYTSKANGTDNETVTDSNGSIIGRSSTIFWNSDGTQGGVSKDSKGTLTNDRPAYVGLAHEIGHAYDHMILEGKWGSQTWYKAGSETKDMSELFAGSFENVIRSENNLSLRLYYGNSQNEGRYLNKPVMNQLVFKFMIGYHK